MKKKYRVLEKRFMESKHKINVRKKKFKPNPLITFSLSNTQKFTNT